MSISRNTKEPRSDSTWRSTVKTLKSITGYDDEEFSTGKRGLLSKYDEEDGKEDQGFRLGAASTISTSRPSNLENDTTVKLNRIQVDMDYLSKSDSTMPLDSIHLRLTSVENLDTSDYLQEGDVGFKKLKVSFRPTFARFIPILRLEKLTALHFTQKKKKSANANRRTQVDEG